PGPRGARPAVSSGHCNAGSVGSAPTGSEPTPSNHSDVTASGPTDSTPGTPASCSIAFGSVPSSGYSTSAPVTTYDARLYSGPTVSPSAAFADVSTTKLAATNATPRQIANALAT